MLDLEKRLVLLRHNLYVRVARLRGQHGSPGPREGMVDDGDLVVERVRVVRIGFERSPTSGTFGCARAASGQAASITSSARRRMEVGTSRPSAFAVTFSTVS
jgi:hypothetical protein